MERSSRSAGRDRDSGGGAVRVLGIDPGTLRLGWGVVEARGVQVTCLASGVLRVSGARADRLAAICDAVGELCARLLPAVLALEQTFVGDNVQSAFRLGEARGAVLVAASRAGVPVVEYSPAEIKVAVAGSGRAAKAQMQFMVARLLNVGGALAEDEADALGTAICHVYAGQFNALVASSRAAWGGAGGGRRSWRR